MMFSFECVRRKKKEAEIKGGKVLEDAQEGHTPKEDKGFDAKQLEKGNSVSSLR